MQLNITTDYAIRIVIYLAIKNNLSTAKEISENLFIPENYIMKIMKKLKDVGIIDTYNGIKGGYKLKKLAEDINLLDIIKTMEKTVKINKCLEEDKCCNKNAIDKCIVHKHYQVIQDQLENSLKELTIKDCINN